MDIEIEERGNFSQKYITETLVFYAPEFKNEEYKSLPTKFKEKLFYISKKPNNESANNYIPSFFTKNKIV